MKILAQIPQIKANEIDLPKVAADQSLIENALSITFLAIGGISVFFMLMAALKYVTSNGDQNQISRAKDTILYAAVGIIISVSAFIIVQFVLGRVG